MSGMTTVCRAYVNARVSMSVSLYYAVVLTPPARSSSVARAATELHEQVRLATLMGDRRETELAEANDRVARLEMAVTAKDEQIELVRSKLRSTSAGGKANAGAAQSLAATAEAMAEEVRVKDEQLGLLRQSIAAMEEEMLANEGRAGANEEKHVLLQVCVALRLLL